jgi:hypothetical protein
MYQHVVLMVSCSAREATCISCSHQGAAFGWESSVEHDGGELARKFSEKFHLPPGSKDRVDNFLKTADCYLEAAQEGDWAMNLSISSVKRC